MGNNLEIQNTLLQSEKGIYFLCTARYKGEPCLCLQRRKDGTAYSVLFDDDNRIRRSVISQMKKKRLVMEQKASGSRFVFKFNDSSGKGLISLRLFLWAKYNSIPPGKAKRMKIELYDKSAYPNNIMDMRSRNLYNAGGTFTDGIEIVTHPETDHKFILVQAEDRAEFFEYTPEMYQMLTTRSICTECRKGKDTGRLFTAVHYSQKKTGYKMLNLSRFVLTYDEFFGRFKNYATGSITRFIHSLPSLIPNEGIDCGHVNANSWNSCKENILMMEREKNIKMSSYARTIQGRYKMFPIVYDDNGKKVFLIEWDIGDSPRLILCESIDDYINMQEFAIGKDPKVKNLRLQLRTADENDGLQITETIPTPGEQVLPQTAKAPVLDRKEIIRAMLNWSCQKDSLIGLYQEHPNIFYHWKNTNNPDNPVGYFDLVYQAILIYDPRR